ncbi:MAG: zinc finger Ran-binding domain-containing protein [Planctomycetes bacterium]|nr:zinc finger Ran-binding domain-containing protein [Planctomycetota bacterium]
MACTACGFENPRKSLVCARCEAKLVWDGPSDRDYFMPPRAGRSKTAYSLRLQGRLFFDSWSKQSLVQGWRNIPGERRKALALSVIPGLGHFYLGEITGLIWSAVWLGTIGFFVFVRTAYSGAPTFLPMGLSFLSVPLSFAAVLIHTAAAVSATAPARFCRTNREARAVALSVCALVFTGYLLTIPLIYSWLEVEVLIRRYRYDPI